MNFIKPTKEMSNFYIFELGQFASLMGSKMTSYALVLWAYGQTGSVISLSILMLCTLVPSTIVGFLVGGLIDRWNKKAVILIFDSIAALFSLLTLILFISGNLKIWHLYGINIMLGIGDAFQRPANAVVYSVIVSKENYMKISSITSFAEAVTTIAAPVAATALYAFLRLKLILIVDFITFSIASSTLIAFVSIKENTLLKSGRETVFQNFIKGIHYLKQNKGVLHLCLFMGFVNFIASIYSCNLAPMVLSRNGQNQIQLGIVSSTIGVASILGSILIEKVKSDKGRIPLIINIMAFNFLICNTALGIGRHYYVWTFAIFIGNLLIPVVMANVKYLLRTKVPVEMQGRIFSTYSSIIGLGMLLGYLLTGIMADKVFEPFMATPSSIQTMFSKLVGTGNGAGIALIYVTLGFLGFVGSFVFKNSRDMKQLDK